MKAGTLRWIAGALSALVAILAIFTFVTGKASLPEIFGKAPAEAVKSSAPPSANKAVSPAASPCESLARQGFRCSAESLLEALATDNKELFSLFVAAGVTGDSIVHSDWDGSRTVLVRAKERKLPGVGSLLVAMSEAGGDACKTLEAAITTEIADAAACAVVKRNACRAQTEAELRRAAADEDRTIGGDYAGLSDPGRCRQAMKDMDFGRYFRLYRGKVDLPQCNMDEAAYFSQCAQTQIMSGRIDSAACNRSFEQARTACVKRECETFVPKFRERFPDRAAFVETFGRASAKLARLRNLEKTCR